MPRVADTKNETFGVYINFFGDEILLNYRMKILFKL